MKELKALDYRGRPVVDSRDVAEMVDRSHKDILRSIRTYTAYLAESNFAPSDFFIEATYRDGAGRELPSYLITRKGCDMIANKLTGRKGVLFTAAYVTAFGEMQEALRSKALAPEVSPGGLAKLISITRRVMLDMGGTPQDVGYMVKSVFTTFHIPIPVSLEKQVPGQMSLNDFLPQLPTA